MLTEDKLLERTEVRFHGESGIDAGGLSKELFTKMGEQLISSGIFKLVGSSNYYIVSDTFNNFEICVQESEEKNAEKSEEKNAENCYKNIGRLLAKSILVEQKILPIELSLFLRQKLLAQPVETLTDYLALLQVDDRKIFDSTMQLLTNQGDVYSDLYIDPNEYFYNRIYDYVLNNSDSGIKKKYLQNHLTYEGTFQSHSGKVRVDSFVAGFHEVIPPAILQAMIVDSGFNANMLSLVLAGPPVTFEDLRNLEPAIAFP